MTDQRDFKTLYETLRVAANGEMQRLLKVGQPSDHLFHMMQYHMGWVDADFNPLHSKGGKRIRPVLLLMATAAAGGDWKCAVPAAAGVELLHNFSLIHDDIEDQSPTRHGRDTAWTIWGIPLAINAGDAMFSVAHLAFQGLIPHGVPAEVALHCLKRFDETCVRLTQGQHDDIQFEDRATVTVDEYVTMITGKTSVLLSLCAELGAIIAQVPAETAHHYAQFGLNLGLAFQIQDDILGIWGDEAAIGKSATSDIVTRKKTLPVLFGLDHDGDLQQLYQVDPADPDWHPAAFVPAVVERLNACGARQFAESEAQKHTNQALDHLESASPTGQAGDALWQLTNSLLKRTT